MMPAVFKGMSMFKRLVVLVCTLLLLPAWAQSQGHSGTKAKPPQTSAQAKARAAADLTARLQARAIAEAAAQAAAQAAVLNQASVTPSAQLPAAAAPENGKPSDVSAPQPSQNQAFAPMQALPAWTELPPERIDALAAPTWVVVPAMPSAPGLSAAQPLTPSTTGLAVPAPVPPSASDPMSQDLAIAQQIHQGLMPCEMGASVRVQADAAAPGYFHVQGKGFRYRMYPVRTSTGALRLEDKKAGAVWLQLANKSMLMDQKKGRRMADDCAHPEQVAYGQDMKTNPPPSLFDKTGMGRSND
jgi:hypothetical protein